MRNRRVKRDVNNSACQKSPSRWQNNFNPTDIIFIHAVATLSSWSFDDPTSIHDRLSNKIPPVTSFVFCSAVQEERGPRVRTKIAAVARDFCRVSSSPSTPLPPPVSLSSSEPGIATPILTTKNTMMRYHTSNASDNTAGISSSSTRQIYSPRSSKILSTGNGSLHPIVLESFSFLSRVDRKGKS